MNKKSRRLTAFLLVLVLAFTTVPVWAEEETVSELQSRYSAMDVLNRLTAEAPWQVTRIGLPPCTEP